MNEHEEEPVHYPLPLTLDQGLKEGYTLEQLKSREIF